MPSLSSSIQRLKQKIASIIFHENWMIGWIDAPIEQALSWTVCPPVRWIGKRSSHYYLADPFAWPSNPRTIFCEEYDFKTQLGRIVALDVQENAITKKTSVPFTLPGHLSYPFLFESQGKTYCLPESSAAGQTCLFEWQGDNGWKEFSTPLPNIAAADSILFEHNGYFWIAYTDIDINPFNNLNLYYAPSLQGPWQAHAGNPVKIDLRTSRCGGTPFRHQGKLYRPVQDCSIRYGGSIRIMEITECSPTSFHEVEITHIMPEQGKNPHGFHTLSAYGNKCLIDGKRMQFSPKQVFAKIWRRICRTVMG